MLLRIIQNIAIVAFAITHISPPAFAYGDDRSKKENIYFEFELSPKEVERLENGLAQLKLGDSIQKAKRLLGKPSSEGELYRKRVFGRSTFVSRYLYYNVKMVQVNGTNVRDHIIAIFFDYDGALVKAERLGYSKSGKVTDPKSFQIVEKIL